MFFFALRLSLVYSGVCSYRFGDSAGTGFYKMLAYKRIHFTIHGEFTHTMNKIGGETCKHIDLSLIQPPEIWYSFKSLDDSDLSDELIQHQCRKHRFSREDSTSFIIRVLNTCTEFEGFIRGIYCRVDDDNRVNVVQEIILQDLPNSDIGKKECDENYRFETPFGDPIIVDDSHKYSMNVFAEKFSMVVPKASRRRTNAISVAKPNHGRYPQQRL